MPSPHLRGEEENCMARKGWPKESGRHSLAARGVRSRKQKQSTMCVAAGGKNPLKEQPKPEEALNMVCAELEDTAAKEAGTEEGAGELLSNDEWLATHIEKVITTFELNDGIRTSLVAKIRKRYEPDGHDE